jgi:hypothetical protein
MLFKNGPQFVCNICKVNCKTAQSLKIHQASKTHIVREKNNPSYEIEASSVNPLFYSRV